MNNEFTRPQSNHGWIEVIVGCMFSGKTEELIKQVRRAVIARQKTQTFKPRIDSRYSVNDVASHDKNKLAPFPVGEPRDILPLLDPAPSFVPIDEGPFFSDKLIETASDLANSDQFITKKLPLINGDDGGGRIEQRQDIAS